MRWSILFVLLINSGFVKASFFEGKGPSFFSKKSAGRFLKHDKAVSLLQAFQIQMSPLVSLHGGRLNLILDIENPKTNAQAVREGNDWNIIVYGGMTKHPDIGEAELTLVLCHELGHHLGGAPTAARDGWSACEGQADYWSTLSCFTQLRPKDEATQVLLKLARLYATQGNGSYPSLEYTETIRPPRTFYGYPSPQCRLDTMIAGLLGETRPACWFVSE